MDYVIDIQGFRDANKKFIPKEVGVISLQDRVVDHWIVCAPCCFSELPPDVRQTNSYCTVNVHGLEWFDGDVTESRIKEHLQNIARKARAIYVRGDEKAKYLEAVMGRRVINLVTYEAPCFLHMERSFPKALLLCSLHGEKKSGQYNRDFCALQKAYLIRKWLYSLLPASLLEAGNTIDTNDFYGSLLKYQRLQRSKQTLTEGRDEVDNCKK